MIELGPHHWRAMMFLAPTLPHAFAPGGARLIGCLAKLTDMPWQMPLHW